jgi:hypothetical protein
MFPEPDRPELRLSNQFALVVGGTVTYTQYKGKTRVQCEECVWCLHESRGIGALPRSARVIRTRVAGNSKWIMMLCHGHADLWHAVDGK